MKIITVLLSLMFLGLSVYAQDETLTITTYYPAPFGIYQRMVSQALGIGDTNASGSIDVGDAPNPAADPEQAGDLWVAGDVGIGTVDPQAQLDVNGNVNISGTLTVNEYTFPVGKGKKGECLKTKGDGTTAWKPCVCPPVERTFDKDSSTRSLAGDGAKCHWSDRWGCQAAISADEASRTRICTYNGFTRVKSYETRRWTSPHDNWIEYYHGPGNWADRKGVNGTWIRSITCVGTPDCW